MAATQAKTLEHLIWRANVYYLMFLECLLLLNANFPSIYNTRATATLLASSIHAAVALSVMLMVCLLLLASLLCCYNTFAVASVPASVMFLVVLLCLASLLLLLVHGVPNMSAA